MTDLPAAVLWDMDGTIVDTEPLWIAAEMKLVADHGATWTPDDSLALVGSDLLEAARYIRRKAELPMTAEAIRDHLISKVLEGLRESVEWCPGARELLAELNAAQVPCALVTMSYRPLAQALLDALPAETFAAVVVGDEVTNGKPHPEPYLKAAEALGVEPEQCVVIEDSDRGVQAGLAAGARVLGVPNVAPLPPRPGADIRDSLEGVTMAVLRVMCEAARR